MINDSVRCAYPLTTVNITDAIAKHYKFPKVDPDQVHYLADQIELNPDWIQYMKTEYDLDYEYTWLTMRPPGNDQYCHVDLNLKHPGRIAHAQIAINWCIGGKGSRMIWYDTMNKKPYVGGYFDSGNQQYRPYRTWAVEDCTVIDSCEIQLIPTLTRVCIPHSIDTVTRRWNISVRFYPKFDTWEQTVDYFATKQWI